MDYINLSFTCIQSLFSIRPDQAMQKWLLVSPIPAWNEDVKKGRIVIGLNLKKTLSDYCLINWMWLFSFVILVISSISVKFCHNQSSIVWEKSSIMKDDIYSDSSKISSTNPNQAASR